MGERHEISQIDTHTKNNRKTFTISISFVCCCWTYRLEQLTCSSVYLRDPELSLDNFRRQLKTFLFAQYRRWYPIAQKLMCLCAL